MIQHKSTTVSSDGTITVVFTEEPMAWRSYGMRVLLTIDCGDEGGVSVRLSRDTVPAASKMYAQKLAPRCIDKYAALLILTISLLPSTLLLSEVLTGAGFVEA